jgi:Fe-S cluster biogenesis protein NfuA
VDASGARLCSGLAAVQVDSNEHDTHPGEEQMPDYSLSFDGKNGDMLRVDADVSMVFPEQCKFTVTESLYPDHSAHFADRDQSKGSPLIDKLFDLGFINDVLVSNDTLTINLKDGNWEDHLPRVGTVVHEILLGEVPAISDEVTNSLPHSDEIRQRVTKVLDDMINPAIASHGGFVTLLDVTNNTVFLEFSGGCHGCGMANVTLKYGVERAIRENVPGVGEILDTTDHAAGRNPFYAPSA